MYRYSNMRPRNLDAPRNKVAERMRTVLILGLIAALVILGIRAVPAIRYQSEAKTLYVELIENECADALTQCNYLSRNAGAGTSATLARIRSNIYAMQTINNIAIALEGPTGRIMEESDFTELFADIDTFSTQMKTGVNTSVQQTDLQTDLQKVLTWLQEKNKK